MTPGVRLAGLLLWLLLQAGAVFGAGAGALPEISGRMAYERPDGVYLLPLGSPAGELLVPGGSYPRWSPDGKEIAFVRDHTIGMISLADRQPVALARAESPAAVAFHPGGQEIWFTDGDEIKSVHRTTRAVRSVVAGKRYRELDIAGHVLAVTVHGLGFHVETLNLDTGEIRRIARGCSASLSPASDRVMVNGGDHKRLDIYDSVTGRKQQGVDAPPGTSFDNQFWSNQPDWVVSVSEGRAQDVFIHQVSTNRSWQVTTTGDGNRPDLFVEHE